MIRFIFNFILFGLLFYALWLYFPDAFTKLTGWASSVFDYLSNLFKELSRDWGRKEPAVNPVPAVIYLLQYFKL